METDRPIRIMVVDDSAVMRSLLRSVVCADAGLEVVGTAANGESALNALDTLCPDLILLDVEMPVMDGLATLRELRRRGHKMPVIMCSALTQRGAKVTIEALASGATDYVTKPAGQSSREAAFRTLAQDLAPKIRALTHTLPHTPTLTLPYAPVNPSVPQSQPAFPGIAHVPPSLSLVWPPNIQPNIRPMLSAPVVLAIGVSTGGPAALDVLLPALPENFPLPVMIVQHMPELFTKLFAERLNSLCRLRVREAAEGDPVRAGTIYIARGDWHMEAQASPLAGSPAILRLNQGPFENHCRPAVDVLFRSVARVYGAGVLAVVLTGMGSDGMIGCRTIRDQGGSVLAQDQATSTVWGMPGAVTNEGLAHKVLPLNSIVPEILRIVGRTHSEAHELLKPAV